MNKISQRVVATAFGVELCRWRMGWSCSVVAKLVRGNLVMMYVTEATFQNFCQFVGSFSAWEISQGAHLWLVLLHPRESQPAPQSGMSHFFRACHCTDQVGVFDTRHAQSVV